jgi:hypothetical protein
MMTQDRLLSDETLSANDSYILVTLAPKCKEAVARKSLRLPQLAQ